MPQDPRHDLAVAVDVSILQLLYSHDRGKLPHEYSQGSLPSCKKNVTRKQPRSQNPVIFSLSLFSSAWESLLQKALIKHCHYSWPINQMPAFLVYIDLIYQTSWQNQQTSKRLICIYLLLNTYIKTHTWKLYFSTVYTRSAQNKLHAQPEGRLHTASAFQLLVYAIKLRDSQLHFPAIIGVVTRRTGAGNGAMVGPSSQKWDRREKPAGEKGLDWEARDVLKSFPKFARLRAINQKRTLQKLEWLEWSQDQYSKFLL